MAEIIKIIRMVGKDKPSAVVYVQLDDGSEAEVWVGGEVEVFFDHRFNKIKAVVKRAQSRNAIDKPKLNE